MQKRAIYLTDFLGFNQHPCAALQSTVGGFPRTGGPKYRPIIFVNPLYFVGRPVRVCMSLDRPRLPDINSIQGIVGLVTRGPRIAQRLCIDLGPSKSCLFTYTSSARVSSYRSMDSICGRLHHMCFLQVFILDANADVLMSASSCRSSTHGLSEVLWHG